MTLKVPATLVLTARLSSGITSVVSIAYILLSILSLIYYFNCYEIDVETVTSADLFWAIIYRTYLQEDSCAQKVNVPNITQSYTVFVLVAITLSFSVVNLITSITLTAMISNKDMTQYLNVFVYSYIGCWVATLVVDVTLATHLGMDITYLANEMKNTTLIDPVLEALRQGAFYLMAVSLKGFAIYAIQLVLICLMIIYLYDYTDMAKRDEHPIHKVGPINAFDQEMSTQSDMYAIDPFPRGHLNPAYGMDNGRPQQNDFYNNSHSRGPGSFRRSDSWNHQGPSNPMSPSTSSARPFSYLEEVRRPAPPAPAVPRAQPSHSNWSTPAPRVPAPDYSPHSSRRLKSALKSNYM